MEFPSTGVQCSVNECKQLDFLPFNCSYCTKIFCKEHFLAMSHSCSQFIDNIATGTEKTVIFNCSEDLCLNNSAVEMLCVKCKRHFCLSHRHHGCLEKSEQDRLSESERWENPKKEFLQAKAVVDQEVTNKLRKSKNSSMANKVQLMRLKSKSAGPNNIPFIERRYFLVHPPINSKTKIFEESKGVFVSASWSIGKVIDSITDSLNIPNFNNVAHAKKLGMFDYYTGDIVTNQMEVVLSELLATNCLIDGQDIILEYSDSNKIDCSLYK